LRGALDVRALRQAGAHCTHFEIVLEWEGSGLDLRAGPELRGIAQEFESFAAQQPLDNLPRAAFLAKARSILEAPGPGAEGA
jgi:hypothetical protein